MEVISSGFASAGLNKLRGQDQQNYSAHFLMTMFDGSPSAIAFYDGEPGVELLGPIVEKIFADGIMPAVHVNSEGVFVLGPLLEY